MAPNNRSKVMKRTTIRKPNRIYADKFTLKLRILYDPAYDHSIAPTNRPPPLKMSKKVVRRKKLNTRPNKAHHKCQGDPHCKNGCIPFYGKINLHTTYAPLDINRIRSTESPEFQLVVHNPIDPDTILQRVDTSSSCSSPEYEIPIKLEDIEKDFEFEGDEVGWMSMTNSGSEAPCGTPTRKLYGPRNRYRREVNRRFREEQTVYGQWPEHGEFFGMSLGDSRRATDVVVRERLRAKGVLV